MADNILRVNAECRGKNRPLSENQYNSLTTIQI